MVAETPIVKNPEEARQAQHVGLRNVLVWSLILVILAFGAIYVVMK
jgi:hypothetical protein